MSLGTTPTLLSRAPLRPYGLFGRFCYDPDPNPPAPAPKEPADKKEPEKKPEPTDAEKLAEMLKAERAKWEAEAAAKQKKADEAAAIAKAKEEGKFKELAEAAEKKAAEAEARALAAERSSLIDAELVAVAKDGITLDMLKTWVKPGVLAALTPETTADDVKKSAKALAEQYAKDVTGAKPKGSAGAPLAPSRTPSRNPGVTQPANNQRPARRFSTLTYRGS